jgi:hypothetical protein
MKTFYENDTITPITQEHITEQENKQTEGKVIKNKYVSFLVFFGGRNIFYSYRIPYVK